MPAPPDSSELRDYLADEGDPAPRLAEHGAALVEPLLAFAAGRDERLELRLRALDVLSRLPNCAGIAFAGVWTLLEDPQFAASRSADDDETMLVKHAGRVLALLVERGAPLDRLTAGLSAGRFPTEYACALALGALLGRRGVASTDLPDVVRSLTERISPRNWFEVEMYEACFDALGAAGPAASPAIPHLVAALGVEVTGERAAIALSDLGEPGHRALVGALAELPAARGGWSRPDWAIREPRDGLVKLIAGNGIEIVPLLIDAAAGDHREQRYFALRALEHMIAAQPPARAVVAQHERVFIAALADTDEYYGGCWPAFRLLAELGTAAALPALDAMAAEDWPDPEDAARAIRARITVSRSRVQRAGT